MNHKKSQALLAALAASIALTAGAANAAPYYSSTTTGSMGDATTWGDGTGLTDGDTTNDSVILEVFFDFTTAADGAAGALLLWEAGDTSGSSLTIKGDKLLLASRHNNTLEVVDVAHGLTAPQAGVQVVSVIDLGANTMTLYVNGSSIGSGAKLQDDWAGGNAAALGTAVNTNEIGARPHLYYPDYGAIASYPDAANADFSFNAYLLADNDVNDILVPAVPEPASLASGLLGLTLLAARRRRR
jgi:hypothetical protein